VIGALVWDDIHAYDMAAEPVSGWGGVGYVLSALAAVEVDWEIVPIVKVGSDLADPARDFLQGIPRLDHGAIQVVPEPNNRVELRYLDRDRRVERLSGGTPRWSWTELEPVLGDLDALYINFISGLELDLETATRIRREFRGPIYADLHSLFLGIDAEGNRTLQPLTGWQEWLRCFDIVQVNEDELRWLAHDQADPWPFAAEIVRSGPRLLLATLGARGAAYVTSTDFYPGPLGWSPRGSVPSETERGFVPTTAVVEGDPTGCGDVWGATTFLHLLSGADLETALRAANQAASLSARHRGALGLHDFLQGYIRR
jgi:sugar/nucleoside kinase (ribokinase family)